MLINPPFFDLFPCLNQKTELTMILLNRLLLQWLLLALFLLLEVVVAMEEQTNPGQFCNSINSSSCGNLKIPYPFGTVKGCFREGFKITCVDANSTEKPTKAFIGDTQYEVINISVAENQVRVRNSFSARAIAHTCLNLNGTNEHDRIGNHTVAKLDLTETPFAIIPGDRMIVTGCNSMGTIKFGRRKILSGCMSFCHRERQDKTNGYCWGFGCCHASIPIRVKTVEINVMNMLQNESDIREELNVTTKLWSPYLCASAFIVHKKFYRFESYDIDDDYKFVTSKIQDSSLLLDWGISSNQSCKEAKKDLATFACKENSSCEDYEVEDLKGYRCFCKRGYQGNPYLSHGCQDINECNANNPCESNSKCINTPGSYYCNPLHSPSQQSQPFQLALGGVLYSIILLLLLSPTVYFFIKRRKLMKLREKFFRENGGLLLQQKNNPFHRNAVETTRIFTVTELAKATNNYSPSRVIGQGGNGTVYKGITGDNNQIVAIKKSKTVAKSQIEQFINEVVIASQINHRNVVKLLGCCLETEVPLLVYEYVPNGSLHYHIHHPEKKGSIPWDIRLKIAAETASALSYLHSAASTPIIHRDVKSANILLDETYSAKVSDFGASRLIPMDKTQITTIVQGTFGYLDPQYLRTGQLTEKSDVYSYGVILVELLTGQMPISFDRSEPEINLSSYFILSMRQDRLSQILEPGLENEENREELEEVANLAIRCLMLNGDERPSMKEVMIKLTELRKIEKDSWDQAKCEQALSSFPEIIESYPSSSSIAYSGGKPTDLALSLDLPR